MEGEDILFKLDTGAMASVLPMDVFEKLGTDLSLKRTKVKLRGFDNSLVLPTGTVALTTCYQGITRPVMYFVSPSVKAAILGQDDCENFGLVRRIYGTTVAFGNDDPAGKIMEEYSDVFSGLGEFTGEYDIQIDESVRPVQQPPRKFPYVKLDKLKDALQEMERQGVIAKVTEPTDWVSNLVITEKKDGRLRICLDPQALNKAILRDPFPCPTLEQIQTCLSGKKVFSVLDQSSAFWQIRLNERSSKLCTFNTPWGRMRFLRMPFGVRCAGDALQRRNYDAFGDIPQTFCIVDDMLLATRDTEECLDLVRRVCQRAREKGVRFNPRKFQFAVDDVRYLGHRLTGGGIMIDEQKVEAIVNMPRPEDKQQLKRFLGMVRFLAQLRSP